MMENVLDDQFVPRQPLRGPNTREASSVSAGEGIHGLETWPHFTSHWLRSTRKRVKDKYQRQPAPVKIDAGLIVGVIRVRQCVRNALMSTS